MHDLPAALKASVTAVTLALLGACGGGGSSDAPAALPAVDVSPVAVAQTASALPARWHQGVFMEIFVRAYQDSDGDGIGDLKGLTSRLDYLKALGISGLWLMPIQPSQDHDHGYAVTDYRAVAPEYGTLADLDELIAQAHARGIGVILDHVINHSAAQHPLFTNARAAADNLWRDWYVWQSPTPAGWSIYGSNPWHATGNGAYFAGFWDQMPDFNLKNGAVVAWHQDHLRFWLNRGVDGFRFDAVGNLVESGPAAWEHQPENHAIMAGVRRVLDAYSQRYMVCEAPSLPQRYAAADSCGGAFAFGYQGDVVRAAQGQGDAVARVAAYWATAPEGMAGFASNHDSFAGQRLWDQLGGNTARLRLAAATYLLQSRSPFIYYGEEIGLAGAADLTGDAALRTPMSWSGSTRQAGFTTGRPFRSLSANVATNNVAAESADAGSLLNFYRQVITLRNSLPALAAGQYQAGSATGLALQFRRVLDGETVWVGINHDTRPVTLAVSGLPPSARLQRRWPAGGADAQAGPDGRVDITLPAQSFTVLQTGQAR